VARDPNLGKLDRNQIIEQLKSEGILGDIIASLPSQKKAQTMKTGAGGNFELSASDSLGAEKVGSRAP